MKDFGEESRKGLTNGLRDFIKIDTECALEVGYMNQGRGTFFKHESRKFQKDARRRSGKIRRN